MVQKTNDGTCVPTCSTYLLSTVCGMPAGLLLHKRFGYFGLFSLTYVKACYALVQPYYHTQN